MMRRTCTALAGVALAVIIGCVSSQESSQPGALPSQKPGPTPRLNASTYMAHGQLLERQGRYERAAEQYRLALELTPNYVEARSRLGITLNKLGQHEDATAEFRRALQLAPNESSLHNNLGFSLYLEGQLEEAERVLARAHELQPDFRRAHMNHAVVLAKLARYDEALDEFLLAGEQQDAYYNLAVVQVDAGHYAAAARTLEKALALNPEFEEARDQLRQISRLAAGQEAELEAARQLAVAASAAESAGDDAGPWPDLQTASDVAPGRRVPSGSPAGLQSLQQFDWIWNQINAIVSSAQRDYAEFVRVREFARAVDGWIEAWIMDAPWYEAAQCRAEEFLGPINNWP